MNNMIQERNKRTEWFLRDRFGMFIHWGLYAIPARGEWFRQVEKISNEAYQQYFDEFDSVSYDPSKWAKAAKEAGMKYAVMTAKHHDGFCLFDSKLTQYKSTNTKAKRDLTREYLEAFRAEGLYVGLYYSLLDWHHDHYPAFDDENHPMNGSLTYKDKPVDFSKYLDYMHGQVRELLTSYEKIDIIWFDFSYSNMTAETWKATELVKMTRELQPGIIIDDRLEANSEWGGEIVKSIKSNNPSIYSGDFVSPEQIIPPVKIVDENGSNLPWEACVTMNSNWGYNNFDMDYKSSKDIIRVLVECVSKGGNLLLNVGPTAKGEIPKEQLNILNDIGNWMKPNGQSIYGCKSADLKKPEWGRYTQKGNTLYAHIYDRGIGPIRLEGLEGKIKKGRMLADCSEVEIGRPWYISDTPNDTFIILKSQRLPDDIDTVVALTLNG